MSTILGNPMVMGAGGTAKKLDFTYTGDYTEREDGVVELRSSGTFRLKKDTEVDLWGIGAGGAGASNSYTSNEGGPAGGGGNFTFVDKYALAAGTYEVTIGAGGTGDGGTTSFANILTASGGTAGDGSKGRTSVGKGTSGNGGAGSTPYMSSGRINAQDGNQNDECREFNSVTGTLRGGGGGGGQTWVAAGGVRAEGSTGGGGYGALNQTAAADGAPNSGAGGGGGVYSPKGLQGKGGSGLLLIRPTQF